MRSMKDVKAIVRTDCVADLIHALKQEGVPRIYVSRVHAFGTGVDPQDLHPSMDEGEAFTEKAKVEFVCAWPRRSRRSWSGCGKRDARAIEVTGWSSYPTSPTS